METVRDFILGGSKITADGDFSHEIKRHLLLGSKAMTNLDSILKSRDYYFANKGPSSQYGCESWTIKKAECWRTDAFELWYWRRLLRVLWTARRSIQSILIEISPEYSSEGLMLKLKLPASGSFLTSQHFTSGGQSIGASASASVLPMNIQDRFPLGLTGLISLQSRGISRVFSNKDGCISSK